MSHQLCGSDWQATTLVFELLDEIDCIPETFVDVGANESQWGRQSTRRYPAVPILSFEPNPDCHPIGTIFPIALSDSPGSGYFIERGGMEITEDKQGFASFQVARFDSLPDLSFARPAVLRVDCESYTARVLKGFGSRIHEFAVVIVEMWNHSRGVGSFRNQQAEMWRFMLDNEFRGARAIATEFSTTEVPFYYMAFYKLPLHIHARRSRGFPSPTISRMPCDEYLRSESVKSVTSTNTLRPYVVSGYDLVAK